MPEETRGFAASRETRILRLALSGEGVTGSGARIPFTLPGERVRLAGDDAEPGPDTILDPSPERVIPPCRHFGSCGGCALQHASDAFLARWKQDLVARALAARGLEASFRPPHVSPPGARRRAVFAGRRTRKATLVGFRAARSHTIIAIEECPVSHPGIMTAMPALHALTALGASRAGALRLAVTLSEGVPTSP